MRHEFMNLPPRIVSRKWTCQLSWLFTLPMDAAMPPSAMTVWALPNSDLQTMAVRRPCERASMAARRPAPPAPMTTTSYSWRSNSVTCGSFQTFGAVRRAGAGRITVTAPRRTWGR